MFLKAFKKTKIPQCFSTEGGTDQNSTSIVAQKLDFVKSKRKNFRENPKNLRFLRIFCKNRKFLRKLAEIRQKLARVRVEKFDFSLTNRVGAYIGKLDFFGQK